MSYKATVEVISWIFKRVDQVSKWLKRKVLTDNVIKNENAITMRQSKRLNDRLRKLKNKTYKRKASK